MRRKGQIVIEYTALIGVGLIFAIIIIGFLMIQSSKNSDERHRIAIDSQLTRIQNEVLAAHTSMEGYYSVVEFMPPYMGVRMNITIEPPAMLIRSSRREGMIYLPPTNGSIAIESGSIILRKTGGIVTVEAV
jgi:hypothetical protein